jgi:predicted nucleotidyltransferase component of viral defense system
MLNIEKHKQVLAKILIEIFQEKSLAGKLGFKGGTTLYFFYDLDRFSTDLDFDLIGEGNSEDIKLIEKIMKRNLKIVDSRTKRFTWFWLGSYEKGEMKIKIEINTRKYPNEYEVKDFRGFSIRVLKSDYMAAHKFCAVLDRKTMQNRDLYDIWFILKNNIDIKEDIIELRMGKKLKPYLKDILKMIRSLPQNYDVLAGLGEVMDNRKKDWVKGNLLKQLEIELASRV